MFCGNSKVSQDHAASRLVIDQYYQYLIDLSNTINLATAGKEMKIIYSNENEKVVLYHLYHYHYSNPKPKSM